MTKRVIAFIGGSGLYDIEGLQNPKWERVPSHFGEASDALLFGTLGGVDVIFLPRHGRGHRFSPTEINYRANIEVLKAAGATDIISLSAVGSLREDLPPGTFVIVDQFIDRTIQRQKSFFGAGCIAHVSMAHPTCSALGAVLYKGCQDLNIPASATGTYLVMEGPQFSTLAESNLYRQWGCDVIGMTNMPEAKLAREAELPYATVAMVTDFDCWHPGHDHVTVESVLQVMGGNVANAKRLIQNTLSALAAIPVSAQHTIRHGLDTAIVTPADARDPEKMRLLSVIARRVLG